LSIALGSFAAFLTRRPFKLVLAEWSRKTSDRFRYAALFLLAYGAVAALGLTIAYGLAGEVPLLPLVFASPLIATFLFYDLRNESRSWPAEIAGAAAFANVAAGIALAAGWQVPVAFALAALLIARAVPSVLYVRAVVRLVRRGSHGKGWVMFNHVLALLLVVGLAVTSLAPTLAVLPFVVLTVRAGIGLSRKRSPVRMRTLGFIEMGLGIFTVLSIVIGFWLDL
jgi:hypothetical protein